MISLTEKELESSTSQKNCRICHYTGKYRGAVRCICNLRWSIPKAIPVIFHNGSSYY